MGTEPVRAIKGGKGHQTLLQVLAAVVERR